jgi:hypothetical protein
VINHAEHVPILRNLILPYCTFALVDVLLWKLLKELSAPQTVSLKLSNNFKKFVAAIGDCYVEVDDLEQGVLLAIDVCFLELGQLDHFNPLNY